jgi:hypothetical protein
MRSMRRQSHHRIFCAGRAFLTGAFLFLLHFAVPSAAAQDPETPPMSPPAAQELPSQPPVAAVPELQDLQLPLTKTTKRAWTNDDLVSSRAPVDQYSFDKEAEEAAAAAQAAAEALLSRQAALSVKLPPTAGATQRAIDEKLQGISDEKDAIDRLHKEFEYVPDEQKAGIQREIERHTSGVQSSEQELKALEDHLKQLNSKTQGETASDSGKQPSQ